MARNSTVSPRESRYSCQSCSIVVCARRRACDGSYGVWLTARTMKRARRSTSRTLMQPGACSKAPRKPRSPVSARPRIARLTAPWRTRSATSQPPSASSASSSGRTRSKSSPIVSPPRNLRVERHDAAERGRHHLLHGVRARAREARRSRSRAARGYASISASGATAPRRLDRARQAARDHAVEADVRASASAAASACARPSLGQLHLVRMHALEVAHLRVAHQIDAPRVPGALTAARERLAAGGLHPGDHPGRRGAVGEACEQLAEQRVGVPAARRSRRARPPPSRCSALTAPPQTWKTWPVMPCASSAHERDDERRDVRRVERIEALRRARPCRTSPRSCACARSARGS